MHTKKQIEDEELLKFVLRSETTSNLKDKLLSKDGTTTINDLQKL